MQTVVDRNIERILGATLPTTGGTEKMATTVNIAVQTEETSLTTSKDRTMVLVSISCSGFGNRRKIDIKDLNENVSGKMITASKALLDSKELREINTALNNTVDWVRRKSVPARFMKKGTYAISPTLVVDVWQKLKSFKENDLPPLIDNLRYAYPTLKEAAKEELKEFFDGTQYPDVEDLVAKFNIKWKFFTIALPNEDSLGTSVSQEFFKEAQQQASEEFNEFLAEAQTVLREEVFELVKKMEEVMTPNADGSRKKIYNSHFERLDQFLQDFSARNIANDTQLQAAIGQLRGYMNGRDVNTVKMRDRYRDEIKMKMATVGAQLADLVKNAPKRNIVRD